MAWPFGGVLDGIQFSGSSHLLAYLEAINALLKEGFKLSEFDLHFMQLFLAQAVSFNLLKGLAREASFTILVLHDIINIANVVAREDLDICEIFELRKHKSNDSLHEEVDLICWLPFIEEIFTLLVLVCLHKWSSKGDKEVVFSLQKGHAFDNVFVHEEDHLVFERGRQRLNELLLVFL